MIGIYAMRGVLVLLSYLILLKASLHSWVHSTGAISFFDPRNRLFKGCSNVIIFGAK